VSPARGLAAVLLLSWVSVPSFAAPAAPPTELFEVGQAHSNVSFAVGFMGLTRVKGQFDAIGGAIRYDEAHPERSSGTIAIDVTTLHTGNELRDRHLKSDDFFDTGKFPSALFQSDAIRRVGGDFEVTGKFTLHGVTRPLSFTLTPVHESVVERDGVRYLNYEGTARIPWRAFGLAGTGNHNPWFKPATMAIDDTAVVAIELQADRRDLKTISYPRLESALARLTAPNLTEGVRRYRALRAQSPDSVKAIDNSLADAGLALIDRGRADDGVTLLALNAEVHGDDAWAHAQLANAYARVGQGAKAKVEVERALALDADEPLARELARGLTP